MRVISLFVIALSCLALVGVYAAPQSTWGIFADSGCNINLYSNNFISGDCTAQTSGSTTLYYITECESDNTWHETQYTDSACTQVKPNTTASGTSGACYPSGQYFGQVVCAGGKHSGESVIDLISEELLPIIPVNNANTPAVMMALTVGMAVILMILQL